MRITLDQKDLVKYPFLKESQNFISSFASPLGAFLKTNSGRLTLKCALDVIRQALYFHEDVSIEKVSAGNESDIRAKIAAYAMSRVLVSCSGDRMFIGRLVKYQAWQAYNHLIDEKPEKKAYVALSVGIDINSSSVPVRNYVEIVSHLTEDRWRLINRQVMHGQVIIKKTETDELIRERIRAVLGEQLPLCVPDDICEIVKPFVDQMAAMYKEKMLEEFGAVEESSFPPCIQAILGSLASGGNAPHMARFAVTAFLHNIGLEQNRIIELYGRAPDFDVQRTMYQVEHISGRGGTGTEYVSPSCATMKTHSCCVNPDSLCSKINHPLSYYKRKKQKSAKKKSFRSKKSENSGRDIPNKVPSGTNNENKHS